MSEWFTIGNGMVLIGFAGGAYVVHIAASHNHYRTRILIDRIARRKLGLRRKHIGLSLFALCVVCAISGALIQNAQYPSDENYDEWQLDPRP